MKKASKALDKRRSDEKIEIPENIQKLLEEFKGMKTGKIDVSKKETDLCSREGSRFISFIKKLLDAMGIADKVHETGIKLAVNIPSSPEESPEAIMKKLWNQRAREWSFIETPLTYHVTMMTLLQNFKIDPKKKTPEQIVSLGSGPGIYEIYLAYILKNMGDVNILCIDSAEEMIQHQKGFLNIIRFSNGGRLDNISGQTDDMTALSLADNSVDQIICNNSLQWTADWKKAISEMGRIMSLDGLGYLYLFVHTHPMKVFDHKGKELFRFGDFTEHELLNELEKNNFEIHRIRKIAGAPGTGQAGSTINRMFVFARYQSQGEFKSWHKKSSKSALFTGISG